MVSKDTLPVILYREDFDSVKIILPVLEKKITVNFTNTNKNITFPDILRIATQARGFVYDSTQKKKEAKLMIR